MWARFVAARRPDVPLYRQGNGPSPDRVDALVWALTELSETARGEPKIRIL